MRPRFTTCVASLYSGVAGMRAVEKIGGVETFRDLSSVEEPKKEIKCTSLEDCIKGDFYLKFMDELKKRKINILEEENYDL